MYTVSTEALPRKRFTRQEVERLLETDIFAGQRYELIDGDLIDTMGRSPLHASTIGRALQVLSAAFGIGRIRIRCSMEASAEDRERSVPEPDVAVLLEEKPDYQHRHPRGDETLLVVEVSETTVNFDLTRKAILYARAGVREYWVVDLVRRVLVVHRQPEGPLYRQVLTYSGSDAVSLEGRQETVRVAELFPAMQQPDSPQL